MVIIMKKYLYGFKLYFLNSFHYRFNTIIGLIFCNASTIITIMFWVLIYSGDSEMLLNGYSLSNMITYFIIGGILRSFIFSGSGFTYAEMIKNGGLNSILLKPYNISISIYFNNLSTNLTGMFPQLAFVIVILPFISRYLSWNLSINTLISLLLFLIISTISSYFLWSALGYMAFWLEEANAVMWSFMVLSNLMTGMFIPLDFFPKWSIPIIEMLPFASWGYIPTKIYLGLFDLEKIFVLLGVHILWIVVLFLINKAIWLKGIKRFSSIGG